MKEKKRIKDFHGNRVEFSCQKNKRVEFITFSPLQTNTNSRSKHSFLCGKFVRGEANHVNYVSRTRKAPVLKKLLCQQEHLAHLNLLFNASFCLKLLKKVSVIAAKCNKYGMAMKFLTPSFYLRSLFPSFKFYAVC